MKIVFLTGSLDILHSGHIKLFEFSKTLGDLLIVGLDSDERIRKNKGPDRPFNTFEDRKLMLESIKFIDKVIGFGTDEELENLLKKIRPDIRICGSDYKNKKIVGKEYCGETVFFDRIEGYSTTKILERK